MACSPLLYDQLGSFLALATYGSVVLAIYGRTEARQTAREILLRVLTFPPFMALIAATLMKSFSYPTVITTILQSLSGTLVPVVMIAVGFQLTIKFPPGTMRPLGAGLGMKLIAAPVAALALASVMGFHGEAARVAVMEAGMPPMVSAGALAIMADLAPELTAALVGAGIVASFLTLPLLFEIVKYFL
jgi:predicted permease